MGFIFRALEKIRKRLLQVGYTCDVCGGELFDYPKHRLCAACESTMLPITRPCERCGRQKRADGLCLGCKAVPPQFTQGVSVFSYKKESAVLINRFKNGNARLAGYLGEKMGRRLVEVFPNLTGENPLVLSVPLSAEKTLLRGYNQAERLAECVLETLRLLGVEAEGDFALLEKRRETKVQKEMTYAERAENVRGAYRLQDKGRVKGRTVVLVDDIMTTGATGSELARVLKGAGAKEVYFLTAASTPERR